MESASPRPSVLPFAARPGQFHFCIDDYHSRHGKRIPVPVPWQGPTRRCSGHEAADRLTGYITAFRGSVRSPAYALNNLASKADAFWYLGPLLQCLVFGKSAAVAVVSLSQTSSKLAHPDMELELADFVC
jgi:hypothetical protein